MMHLFATAEAESPHVSLVAEKVFELFGFPVTNSMVLGLLGYIVLFWIMFFVAGRIKDRTDGKKSKKNRFVSAVQWGFETLYETVESVTGDKKVAKRLAPLAISLFFFIIVQYWVGILPFVGPITWNGIPLFRGLAADLNTTFALAIITIVMAQVYAMKQHGFFGNLNRYFRNPFKDVAGAFEGILELIAEFSRLMGLSLRLFGNVFAGEVLLMMIAYLTKYATPLALPPFMIFELFIGAIQAYIFFMLTVVFVSLGLAGHGHGHEDASDDHTAKRPTVHESHSRAVAPAGGTK